MHPLDLISPGKIVQIREKLITAQAGGETVVRMESGDPTFPMSDILKNALKEISANPPAMTYVPNAGLPELRKAAAAKIKSRNDFHAKPADVFITNGAMHALNVVWRSILEPGDKVIVPCPMWTEAVENIRLAGGVPIEHSVFSYKPENFEAIIRRDPGVKAIFLNSPHNPTGTVFSSRAVKAIVEFAETNGLYVVSDEAYEDLCFSEPHASAGKYADDSRATVISIFSMSKSHQMAGLRIGYIHCSHPVVNERIEKVLRCTINGVNRIGQMLATVALTDKEQYAHVEKAKEHYGGLVWDMSKTFRTNPLLLPLTPRGGFFLWCEVSKKAYENMGIAVGDDDTFCDALARAGVGAVPGNAFGSIQDLVKNRIRLSFASVNRNGILKGYAKMKSVMNQPLR